MLVASVMVVAFGGERDMIIIRDFTDQCWCFVKSCCERALSGKAIDR